MAPLALLLVAALGSPLLAAAADVGLRAQFFSNAALLEPACTATEPSPAALRLDAKALAARCGGKLSPELFSSRFHGSLHLPAGQYQMKLETTGALRFCATPHPPPSPHTHTTTQAPRRRPRPQPLPLPKPPPRAHHRRRHRHRHHNHTHPPCAVSRGWLVSSGVHGWKLVDEFAVPARATETVGKYNFTVVAGRPFGYPVRVDALFTSLPAVITVSYREVGAAAWKPLPQAALSSHVEPNEQKRQDLQRSLSRGWNTWHRASATAHVQLPSAFGFDVTIADPELNATFSKGIVDRCAGADGCRVRPSAHTFDGSFTHFDQKVRDDLVVSVKSAHAPEVNGTVVLLKANASGAAAAAAVAQIELQVASRYYFDCAPRTDSGAVPCGEILARELRGGSHGLLARPIGLQPVYLRAVGADVSAAAGDQPGLTLRMQEGAACLVATVGAEPPPQLSTLAACSQLVSGMEAKVEAEVAAQYPRATVGENRDAVDAIRAVMGWNTMFDHRATVITPVSRSFGQMPFGKCSRSLCVFSRSLKEARLHRDVALGHLLLDAARGGVVPRAGLHQPHRDHAANRRGERARLSHGRGLRAGQVKW
eukprot:COSAG04_NODE_682_length_11188_cov_2.885021_3_plen_595_part_00